MKFRKRKGQVAIVTYEESRALGLASRSRFNYEYPPPWESLKPDATFQTMLHTLNKIKEIELKNKIRNGHKVRAAFLPDTISKFSDAVVYKLMKGSSLFEPCIILSKHLKNSLMQ